MCAGCMLCRLPWTCISPEIRFFFSFAQRLGWGESAQAFFQAFGVKIGYIDEGLRANDSQGIPAFQEVSPVLEPGCG